MKVADIYALLQIQTDGASIRRTEMQAGRFVEGIKRQMQKAGAAIRSALTPKDIGKDLKTATGVGAAAVTAGVGAAVREGLKFDEVLTNLQINAQGTIGTNEQLVATFNKVSKATGVGRDRLAEGAGKFLALTGSGKDTITTLDTFGKVAFNSGAAVSDFAGAAAAAIQQLDIAAEDVDQFASILIRAGKTGSVELKDMSSNVAQLAAQFKEFEGGKGLRGAAFLANLFQSTAKSFGGNADEAATSLRALFRSFKSPKTLKALKDAGIDPFFKDADGTEKFIGLEKLLSKIADSKKGIADLSKISKTFESSEAVTAFNAWWNDRDAIAELNEKLLEANDLTEDHATRMKSMSGKVAVSWNNVKLAIGEALDTEVLQVFTEGIKTVLATGIGLIRMAKAVAEHLGDWAGRLATIIGISDRFKSPAQKAAESRKNWAGVSNQEVIRRSRMGDIDAIDEARRRDRDVEKNRNYALSRGRDPGPTIPKLTPQVVADPKMNPRYTGRPVESGPPGSKTFNATINVTVPPGSDSFGIASIVRKVVKEEWGAEMRRAQ